MLKEFGSAPGASASTRTWSCSSYKLISGYSRAARPGKNALRNVGENCGPARSKAFSISLCKAWNGSNDCHVAICVSFLSFLLRIEAHRPNNRAWWAHLKVSNIGLTRYFTCEPPARHRQLASMSRGVAFELILSLSETEPRHSIPYSVGATVVPSVRPLCEQSECFHPVKSTCQTSRCSGDVCWTIVATRAQLANSH